MATTQTGGQAIETMLLEERRYEPPEDFAAQANAEADIYERDWQEFWETEGRERITWFEPFTKLLEWDQPYAKWYLGGKLNVCFNCVDRHVEAGNGDKVAYYWEGEPEAERRHGAAQEERRRGARRLADREAGRGPAPHRRRRRLRGGARRLVARRRRGRERRPEGLSLRADGLGGPALP